MEGPHYMSTGRSQLSPAILALALLLLPATTEALDFREKSTGLEGLLDVELAYGLRLRTQAIPHVSWRAPYL